MKLAYLFGGQGTQYVGMGADFWAQEQQVQLLWAKMSEQLGFSVADLIIKGPAVKLNEPQYCQIGLVAYQAAICQLLHNQKLFSQASAGLSLGEYSALFNAGVLSWSDLMEVVKARSEIMSQIAGTSNDYGMLVVLGVGKNLSQNLCGALQKQNHQVEIANYNCFDQQVIAGTRKGIEAFQKAFGLEKIKGKLIPLPVTVPSHTSLMEEAVPLFAPVLQAIKWQASNQDFYSNVTGQLTPDQEIAPNLLKQLHHPTYFQTIIEKMLASGIDTFVEIAPRKVLTNFVQKIALKQQKKVTILHINNYQAYQKVVAYLKENQNA